MILETYFEKVKLLESIFSSDERGVFCKPFNQNLFKNYDLESNFGEFFYSTSKKNVIRGMHFQTPPINQTKLIFVIKGKIIDVILDLRRSSLTYGQFVALEMTDDNKAIYIPTGFAHGFLSLQQNTIVGYFSSTPFYQQYDSGIKWDSFGYNWDVDKPIISKKDYNLINLDNFISPFD
ncbi:MAG: hypothetical protein A2086_08155 [Spirochaetes bacterium GWD1_27_9]|nr:MAG: hypothetical protein A2086_08155 [Spirochaetes bacterium GWD1_27_9]